MATVNIDTARTFKDLNLNLGIHPVKKDVNTHSNEYAVINSIKNLVLTNHYERPFQPDIGSNIRSLLFENANSFTATQIERAIIETIDNFEPRAETKRVTVVAAPDENKYNVELEFFIVNNPSPITINFFLERIR